MREPAFLSRNRRNKAPAPASRFLFSEIVRRSLFMLRPKTRLDYGELRRFRAVRSLMVCTRIPPGFPPPPSYPSLPFPEPSPHCSSSASVGAPRATKVTAPERVRPPRRHLPDRPPAPCAPPRSVSLTCSPLSCRPAASFNFLPQHFPPLKMLALAPSAARRGVPACAWVLLLMLRDIGNASFSLVTHREYAARLDQRVLAFLCV